MKSITSYNNLWSSEPIDNNVEISDNTILDHGYLITIPYWAGEKKSIEEIVNLFISEAFGEELQPYICKKIAMVIGINQKEGAGIDISQKLPQAGFVSPFAIEIFGFTWKTDDGKPNMGDINNFIKQSPEAQKLIGNLRKNGCKNIYYAKFDADTISLNQCFSHYEFRIKKHFAINQKFPTIVTSGYITKHEKPQEHGLELGTSLDYLSRMAIAHHLPFSPYVTEANALILLPYNHTYLQEEYSTTREMAGMIKNIRKTRKLDPYVDILFIEGFPITTDYRPTLIGKLQFRGKFEHGVYVGWGEKDLKELSQIWQTHYRDNYRFGHFQDNLQAIFGLEFGADAYKYQDANSNMSIGGCIEFVIKYITRCFDPLTITSYTSPIYIRKHLYLHSSELQTDKEYIHTLAGVLKNYSNYVGWRKPYEEGPSPYVIDRSSTGITIELEAVEEDNKLSDLEDFLYLDKLKEKLSWLLAMYAVKAEDKCTKEVLNGLFFNLVTVKSPYLTWLRKVHFDEYNQNPQKSTFIEAVDGTVSIQVMQPKTFDQVLKGISELPHYGQAFSGEIKGKITRYVSATVSAAHERGIAAVSLLSTKLLLDSNKHIPYLIRQLTVEKKGEAFVIASEKDEWRNIYIDIFNSKPITDTIEQYLEIGRYGCNILHILAVVDDSETLREVLDLFNDNNKTEFLEAKNGADMTPLELAFHFTKDEQVAILIDAGANFDSIAKKRDYRTLKKESLLHIIAAYGNTQSLLKILPRMELMQSDEQEMKKSGVKPDVRNIKNYNGQTPLHLYLEQGNTDVEGFNNLVNDYNYDLKDDDGFTPLTEASTWDSKEIRVIIILLVEKGANSTYRCYHHDCSPLEQAIIEQDLELVGLMLSKINDVSRLKWVLHDPYATGNIRMLQLIADHFDKPQLHEVLHSLDIRGNAPIHIAVIHGHFGAFKLLLKLGTDYDLKNTAGFTASEIFLDDVMKHFNLPNLDILNFITSDQTQVLIPYGYNALLGISSRSIAMVLSTSFNVAGNFQALKIDNGILTIKEFGQDIRDLPVREVIKAALYL